MTRPLTSLQVICDHCRAAVSEACALAQSPSWPGTAWAALTPEMWRLVALLCENIGFDPSDLVPCGADVRSSVGDVGTVVVPAAFEDALEQAIAMIASPATRRTVESKSRWAIALTRLAIGLAHNHRVLATAAGLRLSQSDKRGRGKKEEAEPVRHSNEERTPEAPPRSADPASLTAAAVEVRSADQSYPDANGPAHAQNRPAEPRSTISPNQGAEIPDALQPSGAVSSSVPRNTATSPVPASSVPSAKAINPKVDFFQRFERPAARSAEAAYGNVGETVGHKQSEEDHATRDALSVHLLRGKRELQDLVLGLGDTERGYAVAPLSLSQLRSITDAEFGPVEVEGTRRPERSPRRADVEFTLLDGQRMFDSLFPLLRNEIFERLYKDESVENGPGASLKALLAFATGEGELATFRTPDDGGFDVIAHLPWAGVVSRAAGSGWIFGSTTALGCESRVA